MRRFRSVLSRTMFSPLVGRTCDARRGATTNPAYTPTYAHPSRPWRLLLDIAYLVAVVCGGWFPNRLIHASCEIVGVAVVVRALMTRLIVVSHKSRSRYAPERTRHTARGGAPPEPSGMHSAGNEASLVPRTVPPRGFEPPTNGLGNLLGNFGKNLIRSGLLAFWRRLVQHVCNFQSQDSGLAHGLSTPTRDESLGLFMVFSWPFIHSLGTSSCCLKS
jgi:hypothetical protein